MFMLDTFNVLVPTLRMFPSAEIRQHQTAFGPDETRYLFVQEVKIAHIVPESVASSSVTPWAGSPDRDAWTALILSKEANLAANSGDTWAAYLAALRTLLAAHTKWRVICESDCDQHRVSMLHLTAPALVNLLDSYRTTYHRPIALCVDSPDP